MLNYAKKRSVFVTLDVTDTVSVAYDSRNESDNVFVLGVISVSLVYCIGVHKRTVAVENENIVIPVSRDKISRLHYGVTRSELRLLKRSFYVAVVGSKIVFDNLVTIARYNADILGSRFLYGVDNIFYHRLKYNLTHYLRRVCFHSCTLAAGKNYCTFHRLAPSLNVKFL